MTQFLNLKQISKREFLRYSSATLISLLMLSQPSLAYASEDENASGDIRLGRIIKNNIKMYDRPSFEGNEIQTLSMDGVLPITDTTVAEDGPQANLTWYELNGKGFVHSGSVQPVENRLQEPVKRIPAEGVLAEISVPYTDAVYDPMNPAVIASRLYYASTHWILGVTKDDQGNRWYRVYEDFYRKTYYINAFHLRIIPPEEVSPLSVDVPEGEKKLEVRLNHQLVIAYEGDRQVQLFRCSAGIIKHDECLTPSGDFRTDYKRPSRHMIDGNDHHANTFNLPGVPWISYLDQNGISFHGTYWHNNFGVPMSHGCINLPPEAAKWIYRWTIPVVPYDEQKGYQINGGTKVIIY